MRNFIQYNPNSLKHAAEHKIILLQTYKNKLKNLNRPTDSILILNEIKKQKKIIRTYGSYTIARKTDFELSPAVQTAMKGIIDISNLKKTHSQTTSLLLTKGINKKRVLDSQFYAPIYKLKSFVEIKRTSCTEFNSINSAMGRDQGLSKGSLVNPLSVKIKHGEKVISTQFQCGAIHAELAAKQYIIKMLLENLNQNMDKKSIYLVDARQLKNGEYEFMDKVFGANELGYLTKHRLLIKEQICILNEYIKTENKRAIEKWINSADTKLTLEQKYSLKNIKKTIKFVSLNFSAYSSNTGFGNGFAGSVCPETSQFLSEFSCYLNKNRKKLFAKLSPNNRHLFTQRLKDLKTMLADKEQYLVGHNSLATPMVVGDLLNLFNGVLSIGCYSDKDRGSNATFYKAVTKSIFEYRSAQYGDKANLSLCNFKLEDEEEKRIFRVLYNQNMYYLPTLYNALRAGNKSDSTWIKFLKKQAFSEVELAGHKERHEYSAQSAV